MQKDALNNVHITDEQVLITPDQLKSGISAERCAGGSDRALSPDHF